ncbi:MAG: PmoA family protein [Verrucomicrobiae bacterium]|nr:PmoA family protein [Verrucomicrobiae bacterium]
MEPRSRATRTLQSGGALVVIAFVCGAGSTAWSAGPARAVAFKRNDDKGQLQIWVGGKEALVYCYGKEVDLPHFYPVRSPTGKSMTVQQTEPYPHHRSFWFADTVQIAGQRQASFYNALYSGVGDRENPKPPFRDRVRHVAFTTQRSGTHEAAIGMKLVWEMDEGKIPVLDEARDLRIVALGDGEYFLDLRFALTASHGAVTFRSDAVHYAWPFIRLNSDFNVSGGGVIVNSAGQTGQAETNLKPAEWLDFSRAGAADAEGLAMFSHPANERPHTWLTRDYGCIGPRRVDARSGKPFTLQQGDSISTRVGVLIHRGDVKSGRVAERYEEYAAGKL